MCGWIGELRHPELFARRKIQTDKPVLVGTWRDATWAIQFYQKHGFQLASDELKDTLLEKYWSIPERQVETSVVLMSGTYQQELASG